MDSIQRRRFEPGEYTVRVSKRGYDTWERKLSVMSGDNVRIHAELLEQR